MTLKPLEETERNQLCIVLVLDKELELNGLCFLGGYLPLFLNTGVVERYIEEDLLSLSYKCTCFSS